MKSASFNAASWSCVMVAPLVNCSASSYSGGCVITKSASPQALTHCAKLLATHWGKGLICGAQLSTIFGLRVAGCGFVFSDSVMVTISVNDCNGCKVALSRLTTGTP